MRPPHPITGVPDNPAGEAAAVHHILVVDDDAHIREVVRFALEKAGYRVTEASDGSTALRCFESGTPDLVVLDIIMPGEDGLEVCRRIRSGSTVPILFLSSRDEEFDRVLGLEMGADDYITKPFSPRELVARVKVVLKRTSLTPAEPGEPDPPLRHGDLSLDLASYRCTFKEIDIALTYTEFTLLRTLLGYPGKVYSRDELVEGAYGRGHHTTGRTVDSHIRRIRRKFQPTGHDPIETVYGIGYKIR